MKNLAIRSLGLTLGPSAHSEGTKPRVTAFPAQQHWSGVFTAVGDGILRVPKD